MINLLPQALLYQHILLISLLPWWPVEWRVSTGHNFLTDSLIIRRFLPARSIIHRFRQR